jgi:hypothetical protein
MYDDLKRKGIEHQAEALSREETRMPRSVSRRRLVLSLAFSTREHRRYLILMRTDPTLQGIRAAVACCTRALLSRMTRMARSGKRGTKTMTAPPNIHCAAHPTRSSPSRTRASTLTSFMPCYRAPHPLSWSARLRLQRASARATLSSWHPRTVPKCTCLTRTALRALLLWQWLGLHCWGDADVESCVKSIGARVYLPIDQPLRKKRYSRCHTGDDATLR